MNTNMIKTTTIDIIIAAREESVYNSIVHEINGTHTLYVPEVLEVSEVLGVPEVTEVLEAPEVFEVAEGVGVPEEVSPIVAAVKNTCLSN